MVARKQINKEVRRIVCFSGGHSSALVAIEVVRQYGKESVVLLNHDINPARETEDIKRFKSEVAEYLGLPITYANHPQWETITPIQLCINKKGFHSGDHNIFCTHALKTLPFTKWMSKECKQGEAIVYYGFDANEKHRIQRRSSIIAQMGYRSDYPLALWSSRTIFSTDEIGIKRPNTYSQFKHANCLGCLKAGKQHWYIIYLNHRHIFEEAKVAEDEIGHSIIKGGYMSEFEVLFEQMSKAGITTTEHESGQAFFARAKKWLAVTSEDTKPCECFE